MPQESINTVTQRASFSAAVSGLNVAAAATDFFGIRGADGKRIIINRILISGIATSATAIPLTFVKRSTINTGSFTAVTAVPSDSTNGTVAAATVCAYTTNPSVLGTAVGTVSAMRLILSTASASVGSTPFEYGCERMFWRPIVLNGLNEGLYVNYGGATAAGNAIDLMVAWTEEQI